ncbi:FecR family protein [Flammeovirgaceae bacterium SG7u.111]|nr:FecR family protein [Flammeovirgaceae bacterium SG7u.132]WPO36458.1 FecR family protein [Flammeovirgaceae bacterium SG7u.111]
MKYTYYTLEDFITDEFFIKWAKDPDEESDRFWQHWIANNPQKKKDVTAAIHFIRSLAYDEEYVLEEDDRNKMIANILESSKKKSKIIPTPQKTNFPFRKMAASLLILLVAGLSLAVLNKLNDDPVVVEKKIPLEIITKKTVAGQKLTLTLSDGSKVKLNSNTEISFPKVFGDSIRFMKVIKGEAFFDIAKMPNKPFIIKTGDYCTKVLGTSFNVTYDETSKAFDIALVTGKVEVKENDSSYRLHPNERLNLNNGNATKTHFDPFEVTAWKDGILIIKKLNFTETISELENWYGVKFICKKQYKGLYSGIFENETLNNVMNGLHFSENMNFKIVGNTIIVN